MYLIFSDWPFLQKADGSTANWQGKWFPQSPDKAVDDNPLVDYSGGAHHDLSDPKHGIKMGIPSPHCDDGKVNKIFIFINAYKQEMFCFRLILR